MLQGFEDRKKESVMEIVECTRDAYQSSLHFPAAMPPPSAGEHIDDLRRSACDKTLSRNGKADDRWLAIGGGLRHTDLLSSDMP